MNTESRVNLDAKLSYLTCGCFYLNFQFTKVFSSFRDVKVIQFSSMQDAFKGFTDKVRPFCLLCLKFCFVFVSST